MQYLPPALALVVLLASPLHAGRRPALSGARLEAAKRDWQRMQPAEFKKAYRLSNGSFTRLRRANPGDFEAQPRTRRFDAAELKRMDADFARVGHDLTLTQFKELHRLSSSTWARVQSENPGRFEAVALKLGGKRLAEQRRAQRLEPARVARLAAAWEAEVTHGTGKDLVGKFCRKHGTSRREITELRQLSADPTRFAPATGAASRARKKTLSPERRSELSRLWKAGVVSGDVGIGSFWKANRVPQRLQRELRADERAFPDPPQLKHGGGPARRSFSAAELAAIALEAQQVTTTDQRAALLKKWRIDSKMKRRLRDAGLELPSFRALSRRVQLSDRQLDAMRDGWLLVIAGLKSESAFRRDNQLSAGVFRRVREEPELAADFPRTKGARASRAAIDRAVVADWAAVRAGELAPRAFRRRHPEVRAEDLLGLQQLARQEGMRGLAERLGLVQPAAPARAAAPKPERKPEPGPRPGSKYDGDALYSPAQLAAARALFARHQRGELALGRDVKPALRKLGFTVSGQGLAYLRKIDPEGFAGREEFLIKHQGAIVSDLIRIATAHRDVIRKWSDLQEVAAQDASFAARWGTLKIDPMVGVALRDRKGDGRLRATMARLGTQVGKLSGARGGALREQSGARLLDQPTASRSRSTAIPRLDSARALSAALAGQTPSRENLERTVARLARSDRNFKDRRGWMGIRAEFAGVFPELAKWSFDPHRPYSLRYVARWTEAAHQAGPGADYEQIAAIFRRSPEYKEDGRLPPKRSGTVIMAKQHPELITSWAVRRTYQRTRQLLELLRTAPAGASLYSLSAQVKAIGLSSTHAHKMLGQLTPAAAERHGMSRQLFTELKRAGFRGLGQAESPAFDPQAEPPGIRMDYVRNILATPGMPPLLETALRRLDGQRPFESHNVMFIGHRYSDVIPMVDAFTRAGMQRENALFVSTPYPFQKVTAYQLRKRGIRTIVPRLDMDSYARAVELGLRRMLKLYDQQRGKWGAGKPILIVDDGGMAAKMIAAKFRDHAYKFRIVEQTAAGVRLAREFKKQRKRLPFVYYSIGEMELKRRVNSTFFGRRVADRTLDLIPQTGVELRNKRVAVIGGGAMGFAAGKRLRQLGYDVTFVEKDDAPGRQRATMLRRRGFAVTMDIKQALRGRGMILGMTGVRVLGPEHLKLIADGAVVVQGSSKRNEFDMSAFERMAQKTRLPRTDGLSQASYTYSFRDGKRLHFFGDGWTINHDGSLHGVPMRDVQLELAVYFASAVKAAQTPIGKTNTFYEIAPKEQLFWLKEWRRARRGMRQ